MIKKYLCVTHKNFPNRNVQVVDSPSDIKSCSNISSSPIISAFKDSNNIFVPKGRQDFSVVFFSTLNPLLSLNEVKVNFRNTLLDTSKKSVCDHLWISHGLANVIYISDPKDSSFAEKLADLFNNIPNNLVGYEKWEKFKGQFKVTPPVYFHEHKCSERTILDMNGPRSSGLNGIVSECEACLNKLSSGLSIYNQKMAGFYVNTKNHVEWLLELIDQSNKQYKEADKNDDEWAADFEDNIRKYNKAVSDIVSINSALSYVNSQAFTGALPILFNECPIRGYSLLGVGSSFRGLFAHMGYITDVFQQIDVENIIRLYRGITIPAIDVRIFKDKLVPWPEQPSDTIEDFSSKATTKEGVSHAIFMSGRNGFRSTDHFVSVPLHILSSCSTSRWSLMVNNHEFMHIYAKRILEQITPTEVLADSKLLSDYLEKFERDVQSESENSTKVDAYLFDIITYYISWFNIDSYEHKNGQTDHRMKVPSAQRFEKLRNDHWEVINELLAHSLDFIYFYNGEVDVYIKSIWDSWAKVPNTYDEILDYIYRSVSLIAASLESGSREAAFDRILAAYKAFKQYLFDMIDGIDNTLARKALIYLEKNEAENKRHIEIVVHDCLPKVLLLDYMIRFFLFKPIRKSLNEVVEEDEFPYNRINVGVYDYKVPRNPHQFIYSCLVDGLEEDAIRADPVKEEIKSLWILMNLANI